MEKTASHFRWPRVLVRRALATKTIDDDGVAQAEQCLKNIEAALTEAGATFADVVRVSARRRR